MIRITNFDIVIHLYIAGGHRARTLLTQRQLGFFFTVHHQSHTFKIKQDFYHILLHTFDRAVFVKHAINFYFGNRTTGHRRKQYAAKRVTKSVAKAALQRLQSHLGARAILFFNIYHARGQKFVNCTLHWGTCLLG